jgi:hypothetical protein
MKWGISCRGHSEGASLGNKSPADVCAEFHGDSAATALLISIILRLKRLKGRRSEFIDPVLGEILEDSGIHSRIEKLRDEVAALENIANDFGGDRGPYGSQARKGQCKEFADALIKDPRAECKLKLW